MSTNSMSRPRVFLSYSRHSEAHVAMVRCFREFLRNQGVDVRMDVDGDEQPRDIPKWIAREFADADYVLSLVSREYRECFEDDSPREVGNGVRNEGELIRDALYSGGGLARRKYLPVVLPHAGVEDIPADFRRHIHTYYEIADFSVRGARNLLRYIGAACEPAPSHLDVAIRIVSGPVVDLLTPLREPPALLVVRRRADVLIADIEGTDETVAAKLGTTLRVLREEAQELGIEAYVGVEHHGQQADALVLTEHEALAALRTLPGARIMVALSPGVHEFLVEMPDPYPPGPSLRRVEDPPAWVALLGRRVCPPIPEIGERLSGPQRPLPNVSVSGTNSGVVAAAGRDVIIGDVHRGPT